MFFASVDLVPLFASFDILVMIFLISEEFCVHIYLY